VQSRVDHACFGGGYASRGQTDHVVQVSASVSNDQPLGVQRHDPAPTCGGPNLVDLEHVMAGHSATIDIATNNASGTFQATADSTASGR
jgi:hypothetical protein